MLFVPFAHFIMPPPAAVPISSAQINPMGQRFLEESPDKPVRLKILRGMI